MPDVIEILNEQEYVVRLQATTNVAQLGPDAKAALPILVKLLRDPEPAIRDEAAKALKAVDEEAARQAGVI